MYKVMIIDDEKIICQGVSSKIRRINHPKIDEVIESTDPIKALKIISDENPDIIITDMEMPNLSGLELVSHVSDMAIQPKFIVLSGHDDYRYVRNSFQLGVIDYILKPVTIDELTDKLYQAIELIELEKNAINPLYNKISIALNTVAFSKDTQSVDESYEYLHSILHHQNHQLASISLSGNYQLDDMNAIAKKLINSLDDNIETVDYYDSYRNFIILFNYEDIDMEASIQSSLRRFLYELSKEKKFKVKIALTTTADNIMEYKDLLHELQQILATKIQYNPFQLLTLSNVSVENKSATKEIISQLVKWFSTTDFNKITCFIDDYFVLRPINHDTYTAPEKIFIIILQKTNELFSINDLYQKELFSHVYESFDSYMEIRIYLKSCIQKIQQFIDEKDASSISAIELAKAYIDAHLDEALSMAQVSNYLSLNYSYFSKLFKAKLGISFKKYLINERMEKAKILLKNPTNKVYEVAQQIGYDNAQNFSRAFKNHYGYSPKEYRTNEYRTNED